MESFNVGEIVWAKIRGYPWWPAKITGAEDDNKEKKYTVFFIGDNTYANLQKKYLTKFEKGYKEYSNTKKKDLLDNIKIAKEQYDERKEKLKSSKDKALKDSQQIKTNQNNSAPSTPSLSSLSKEKREKDKDKKEDELSEISSSKISTNLKNTKGSIASMNNSFLKKKTKRPFEKAGAELLNNAVSYVSYIARLIFKKNLDKIKEDKSCILKVMEFLKDFKMNEPIDFLKKTNLGKLIKYINVYIEEKDIKESSLAVYKNLEEQVYAQLFKKAK